MTTIERRQPARSTHRARVFFSVIASAWIAMDPASAGAQLLGAASSAARGDDGGGQSSQDDSDDDRSDDSGGSGGGGLLGSASEAARGSDPELSGGGGGGWSARGSGGGWSGGGWSGGAGTIHVHRARPAVPYRATSSGPSLEPEAEAALAGTVELEAGYVLAGAGRLGAGARLELPFSIDLAVRYSVFVEPLDGGFEALALGRYGIAWRAVDDESAVLRLGVGLRHLEDRHGGIFGGDVVFGMDLFLVDPLIASSEIAVGFVGQAVYVQGRASLGVLLESCEIYAGYDFEWLWAGRIAVDLGGPMLGVRAWL